ncbi:penicillin acylase family protein [Sphingomonas sp. RB56-2]|uniref:Penicillin acylase family protein n=1 Tax=Sphingomonas brevis TaxID=2908206 RepID=A0ABT0SCD7_9SPHN|nr:penicillin acylase family protein [Sphingomonas brevis]MCL6742074.1 penicillin acylase family protein [Sphingomonas brevis]
MRPLLISSAFLLIAAAPAPEASLWKEQAARVSIVRDDWGIAHIEGPTDADAVFGMIYAQAEDDFPRIEANYLTALGRTAEADGEGAIWQDLRVRLYVSETELKADYSASPDWLKKLMDSWAAGLNYYLATHPTVKPRVLTRFEPWMALSFTEGSIGGDIERIDLQQLERFYGGTAKTAAVPFDPDPRGSNGIAIAPGLTKDGKALLLINPHTSFFFRAEQQVTSGQGLNAYGAATWGQFFIYQGFNGRAGWMHTSSGVDNVDEFAFDVSPGKQPRYRYGNVWRPMSARPVTIRYRLADGKLASRSFTSWRTHRGPIVRAENGRWIAFAMMDRPVQALQQSFLRTRATDLSSFLSVARLQANSSNNTIYADADGRVAYLHPQFVPTRNDRFDYTKVVDGSDPATDWGGLHGLTDLPSVISPPNGWVTNSNNWPYSAAGAFSAKPQMFPKYMDSFGENYRGIHAQKLLERSRGWTLEGLQRAAYDSDQPGFAVLVPQLVAAWDGLAEGPRKEALAEPVNSLRQWDYRWSGQSEAQSLAIFWGEALRKALNAPESEPSNKVMMRLGRDTSAEQKLAALEQAIARLQRDFGNWQVPWGEINRYQRISPAIAQPFSDSAPSLPVPFAYGIYGSLASSNAAPRNGSKRWYGTSGNSFVAVVEFGDRVTARAVSTGGQSGDPSSKHFNDQAGRYAAGDLRPVYFYPEDLLGHIERRYHPGE